MSKTDKDVWEESLHDKKTSEMFQTEAGGPNAKPLPIKEIFKSPKERKLEERVKLLEKQLKQVHEELITVKDLINEVKKEIRIVKNKPPEQKQRNN